jgi:hypothetical protein
MGETDMAKRAGAGAGDRYAGLDSETFDRILRETVNDNNPSACDVLQIPGVYEILSEHYNNDVLDRWEQGQTEPDEDEDEDVPVRVRRLAQLHPDAPAVPPGLQPRPGVEYGCGKAECTDCYEPAED